MCNNVKFRSYPLFKTVFSGKINDFNKEVDAIMLKQKEKIGITNTSTLFG